MPQTSDLVFTLDKKYRLKNDGSMITLDLTVGDIGQSPDLDVKLNTKKLLEGHNESIKKMEIGADTDLDKKILKITGNIVDASKTSNKIKVSLKVKGGINDLSHEFSVTVQEEGESVDLAFVIRFAIK